jgi:hypothetical protein
VPLTELSSIVRSNLRGCWPGLPKNRTSTATLAHRSFLAHRKRTDRSLLLPFAPLFRPQPPPPTSHPGYLLWYFHNTPLNNRDAENDRVHLLWCGEVSPLPAGDSIPPLSAEIDARQTRTWLFGEGSCQSGCEPPLNERVNAGTTRKTRAG